MCRNHLGVSDAGQGRTFVREELPTEHAQKINTLLTLIKDNSEKKAMLSFMLRSRLSVSIGRQTDAPRSKLFWGRSRNWGFN